MTSAHWSAGWTAIAPALGDHLWQSTLVAVAAGLLTLILRKQHARVRYGLWLAASVKFLVPFALLVNLGNHLAWSHVSAGAKAGLYVAVEELSQPFTPPAVTVPGAPASASMISLTLLHLIPSVLIAIWLFGVVAVVLLWCVRWRRVSAALRESVPLREGIEVETLRRLERLAGMRASIEIVSSRATLEPGIFGIVRPVLIWPEGISQHLESAHLEAILAHEVWHARRRDNLAAAIHMMVEALFWLHPLVWWLGARMVEERERACDEDVLELGSERHVYAESILKVCEFCVGSPLACVSGVTGSDLKKRMVYIMTERIARKLDFGKKLLLSAAGVLALALPLMFGLLNATPTRAQGDDQTAGASLPKYTATIRPSALATPADGRSVTRMEQVMFSPNGFLAANVPLQTVIQEAYGVQANQISGAPDWVKSVPYDVEVKFDKSESPSESDHAEPGPSNQSRQILRSILADRFKLTLHRETKNLSSYALVVAEDGSKLQPSQSSGANPVASTALERRLMGESIRMKLNGAQDTVLEARGMPTVDFASQLSRQLGSVVVDKTGLAGKYDFTLKFSGNANQLSESGQATGSADAAGESAPSIFTALEQQLGLKLEAQKAQAVVLVIDHVEAGTEN